MVKRIIHWGLPAIGLATFLAGCEAEVRPDFKTDFPTNIPPISVAPKVPLKIALMIPPDSRDFSNFEAIPSGCSGEAMVGPVGAVFEQTTRESLSRVYEQVDLVQSFSEGSSYHAVIEASLTKVTAREGCMRSRGTYAVVNGALRAFDLQGNEVWRSAITAKRKNGDDKTGADLAASAITTLVSDWVQELGRFPTKRWAKGGASVREEERTARARDGKEEETVIESDVDRPTATRKATKKNAYAVVFGIEKYREKLPKADFAARDAKIMGEYLTKVLGYPEENVVVRTNDLATRNDMEKYFGQWLKNNVEPGGSVFIYYSGHGAPNPKTGDAYLVPYDGDPTYVDTTAFPLKRLYESLDKLPAKEIVVVLDSCFSGAGGRSVLAKGAKPMGLSVEQSVTAAVGKAIVLTASGGDQISSAYEEKGHGLMTYFFLKGLQGDADANEDGTLTMAELYNYVRPQVEKVARKQFNNEQTPQFVANPEQLKRGGATLIEKSAK